MRQKFKNKIFIFNISYLNPNFKLLVNNKNDNKLEYLDIISINI